MTTLLHWRIMDIVLSSAISLQLHSHEHSIAGLWQHDALSMNVSPAGAAAGPIKILANVGMLALLVRVPENTLSRNRLHCSSIRIFIKSFMLAHTFCMYAAKEVREKGIGAVHAAQILSRAVIGHTKPHKLFC